jgi:hypothetical protein
VRPLSVGGQPRFLWPGDGVGTKGISVDFDVLCRVEQRAVRSIMRPLDVYVVATYKAGQLVFTEDSQ